MIAVDTNILVHAHRAESPWHERAAESIAGLANARGAWSIPWPCLHEFLAVVTHPRIFDPPTPAARAIDQVEAWLESPGLVLLAETATYWDSLRQMVLEARVTGPMVHDARIAALCEHHGVSELWSADRDFGRFVNLTVRNPLV